MKILIQIQIQGGCLVGVSVAPSKRHRVHLIDWDNTNGDDLEERRVNKLLDAAESMKMEDVW